MAVFASQHGGVVLVAVGVYILVGFTRNKFASLSGGVEGSEYTDTEAWE